MIAFGVIANSVYLGKKETESCGQNLIALANVCSRDLNWVSMASIPRSSIARNIVSCVAFVTNGSNIRTGVLLPLLAGMICLHIV